jgi:hypothetical protein
MTPGIQTHVPHRGRTGYPDVEQHEVRFYGLLMDLQESRFMPIFTSQCSERVIDTLMEEVLSKLHPHVI